MFNKSIFKMCTNLKSESIPTKAIVYGSLIYKGSKLIDHITQEQIN